MHRSPNHILVTALGAVMAVATTGQTFAANLAFDSAAHPVYNDGWQTGDNGGFGFGPWALLPFGTGSGHFMASSTGNGDALDDGLTNGLANDGDIDTAGRAWGMYAWFDSAASGAGAFRPLTGGPLTIGQSIAIDMDNGYITSPGANSVGIQFLSSSDSVLFRLEAGDSHYEVYSSNLTTVTPTTLPAADEGLTLSLTRTGPNSVSLTATLRNGMTQTLPLSMTGASGADIQGVVLINDSAGQGPAHDTFFNSIVVTPEPASLGILAVGALATLTRRKEVL